MAEEVNVEGVRQALEQHKEFIRRKRELDANQDRLAEKLNQLRGPIPADEVPRLLQLVIEQQESHRKTLVAVDERLDVLFTQHLEATLAIAEALERRAAG